MEELTPDQLLTTTRSVRKRLDFDRSVSRSLITECLEKAFQAPNGSNLNAWHWLVVDDREKISAAAQIYNRGLDDYVASLEGAAGESYLGADVPGYDRLSESVDYLRENLHRSPALLVPVFPGRVEGASVFMQASLWGSILQATWSFFLALRARGLGSAWTTGHLLREREMAELFEIPAEAYTQVGLFPIAYTLGSDFHAAYRKPAADVVSWNKFRIGK